MDHTCYCLLVGREGEREGGIEGGRGESREGGGNGGREGGRGERC